MVAKVLGSGDEQGVSSFSRFDFYRAVDRVCGKEMIELERLYCNYPNAQPAFTVVPSVILVKAVLDTLKLNRIHWRECTGLCPGLLLSALESCQEECFLS